MRYLLVIGLLASFQLARCQKFPSMVGNLPKLYKELPNPVQCPTLPECFNEYYPIDRVFSNAGEFVIWLQQHSYCCAVIATYQLAQVQGAAHSRVHVKAQSLKEAICQVVWAYPLTWHVWPVANGLAVVLTEPRPDHNCNHSK